MLQINFVMSQQFQLLWNSFQQVFSLKFIYSIYIYVYLYIVCNIVTFSTLILFLPPLWCHCSQWNICSSKCDCIKYIHQQDLLLQISELQVALIIIILIMLVSEAAKVSI